MIFKNLTKQLIITCFDENLNILGFIDEFKSFAWNYTYSGVGTWTLTASTTSTRTMNLMRQSTFILVHNIPSATRDKRTKEQSVSGIITEIQQSRKPSGDTFTAKGKELKGLANRRIIKTIETYSSTIAKSIMEQIIRSQITNPTDANRQIVGAILNGSTNTDDGETPDTYSNVGEALTKLSEAHEIGWRAVIDYDEIQQIYGISWAIYDGVDRTGNGTSDPIYLTFTNDTLETANYKINMNALQNFAYIGGKGEGASRVIQTTYDTESEPTGINRYETFVDARNEENADLVGKGNEALSDYESTDTIRLTPSWALLQRFGSDYNVGDLFLFVDLNATMRLTEATLTFEGNKINCEFTFGYENDDFKSAMRVMLRNYKNMLNT